MKTFRTILFAALALCAAVTVSCSKEDSMPVQGQQGTINVEVNGILGEYSTVDDTKAGLASNIRVKWAAGDVVYAFDGATCLGSLTVSLKDGKDYYAVLSGELSVPQAGTEKISLVYSNAFSAAPVKDAAATDVTIDLSSQTASDSPDNVKFAVCGTLDYSSGTPAISDEIVDFTPATSIIRLNCSGLEASIAITSATLKGAGNKCKLSFAKDGPPRVAGTTDADITLDCTGISASAKGTKTVYVAIAPNATAAEQVLEVEQGKKYEYSLGSNVFSAAESINAVCPVQRLLDGALSGKFSVTAIRQVRFSKGNLQATYDGSKYTWGFAANQYDYIGDAAGNTTIDSQTSGAVVDLFGWSTSATNFGISTSEYDADYSGDFVDWGKNIDNKGTWRTLSNDEWTYLFKTRPNASKLYKYGVTVCGKTNCVIIAPDGYTETIAASYDTTTWPVAEAAGLVCLPAAGSRDGSNVRYVGDDGYYWSSSAGGSSHAYLVYLDSSNVSPGYYGFRYNGGSVRLIAESK